MRDGVDDSVINNLRLVITLKRIGESRKEYCYPNYYNNERYLLIAQFFYSGQ